MNGKLDFTPNKGKAAGGAAEGGKTSKTSKGGEGELEDLEAMAESALAFFRAAVDPATSKLYTW